MNPMGTPVAVRTFNAASADAAISGTSALFKGLFADINGNNLPNHASFTSYEKVKLLVGVSAMPTAAAINVYTRVPGAEEYTLIGGIADVAAAQELDLDTFDPWAEYAIHVTSITGTLTCTFYMQGYNEKD